MLALAILAAMGMPTSHSFAVYLPVHASNLERLAAREVRRYLYVRTGVATPLLERSILPARALGVVVGRRGRPLVDSLGVSVVGRSPDAYRLKTVRAGRVAVVMGATDVSTLYGAYAFAEQLGVRFYLHGDTVPDRRIPLGVPKVDESGSPLFRLRGIQPFHDFAEGPDWWDREDYLAVIDRLPKLKMNFIGLHTYPEPIAEPTVWIGRPEDVEPNGDVSFAYPAAYQNTMRGDWGYSAKPTSRFGFGAAELFETDAYGNDVMRGLCPRPVEQADCDEVFNREGRVLAAAFREAHALGVKTCVGTETPLTVPGRVKDRMRVIDGDPDPRAARSRLYEGIFKRITATHLLDYYWLWTPEGWTWGGNSEADVQNTLDDLDAALAALHSVRAPFKLATCGWVLGPQSDRALFDRKLPKDVAMSCINRSVGMEPVDPGFADVHGREKWAIPWMEDDPALTAPQLWVARMRRDAEDARRYGCTGLMGIHWRTRAIAPNVAALARAAWDQKGWPSPTRAPFQALGGNVASYGDPFAGTAEPKIYGSVRWSLSGYRIKVPRGVYRVTLKFSELAYDKPGARVFDVSLNGRSCIEALDIFAKVGKDKALDYTFEDVHVDDGSLRIGFTPRVEFPCIAGIVVESPKAVVKINCGGPATDGYLSDLPNDIPRPGSYDLYLDWSRTEFGPEAAEPIARLFASLDGRLPRPLDWIGGPGGVGPDARPWISVARDYAFVEAFERFAAKVKGPGNRARYSYWVKTFEYLRSAAQLRCAWGALEESLKSKARDAVSACSAKMASGISSVMRLVIDTVGTTGEMGTLANWEQHNLPGLEDALRRAREFEGSAAPGATAGSYGGRPRIMVPTVRTRVDPGVLHLKLMILSTSDTPGVTLWWRPLRGGAYTAATLRHIARAVFEATVPATEDFEYYIATPGDVWPATAPSLNQTVVVQRIAD